MLEVITIISVLGAIILLILLSYIDIKTYLLPNELVAGFATCGFIFHLSTLFSYLPLQDMALGAFIGGGTLYLVRGLAGYFYGEDALGLGDVKLLAAGGLWLGSQYILIAMTIGAIAGLLHGIYVAVQIKNRSKVKVDLHRLCIPAGPGFAVGLFVTGLVKFVSITALLSLWNTVL